VIESSLGLLVVLAALAAVPLVVRRHKAASPDGVRVVGRTALSKNAVVAVLAVGDRRLLVGAGERGVHLIAELDAADPTGLHAGSAPGSAVTTTGPDTVDTRTIDARTMDNHRVDRMDVVDTSLLSAEPTVAHDVLAGFERAVQHTPVGPRIGLVDRLRVMTVRTPVQGRPFHDILRR
jgi:flagellar biogenesis protein FliO